LRPVRIQNNPLALQQRFKISCKLAEMLVDLEAWAERHFSFQKTGQSFWPGLRIISGQRTRAQNTAVGGAPESLHLACPARAADLRVGSIEGVPSENIWEVLGTYWQTLGGRWGGKFGDPDRNHFDLGA